MFHSIDHIARQARQGSISAIIQILNDKLADSGVRTRAMLDGGVLQVLCEASTADQLEQTFLVERIQHWLEGIGPQNIRRVNINSRIVREQQLLWLDEIQRDPESQLLWSQEVRLKQPNPFKRWWEDRRLADNSEIMLTALPKTDTRKESASRHFWRGLIVGGTSLGVLALLVGWAFSDWLGLQWPQQLGPLTLGESPIATESAAPPTAPPEAPDPFVQAVRLAEQAVLDGQNAQTSADWLDLASRWQRASDLMGQVPPDDSRYTLAQDRTTLYSQNSEMALQRARMSNQVSTPSN